MVDHVWVMAARKLMIFLWMWFLFFHSILFLPPLCHSTVTGTYLWDICRKVAISMWKGSCRQCYALCIHQHLYEMRPLSFLLGCNLLAIFQAKQGEQSKEGTWATTTPIIAYATYMKNSLRPPSQETSNARKCRICQKWLSQLSGSKTHYQVACVNEEEVVFLLTQRQHRQAVNRAFDPWDLLCSCHFRKISHTFSSTIPYMRVHRNLDC